MESFRAPRLCMRTIVPSRKATKISVKELDRVATCPPYPSSAHSQPVWARKGGRACPTVVQLGSCFDRTAIKNVSNILAKYWKLFSTDKLEETFFLPLCNASRDGQRAVCDIRATWCGKSIVNSFIHFLKINKANDNRRPTFRLDTNARFFALNWTFKFVPKFRGKISPQNNWQHWLQIHPAKHWQLWENPKQWKRITNTTLL